MASDRDPVADQIHAALGIDPTKPETYQKTPFIQKLAKQIDEGAEAWLAGRTVSIPLLEKANTRHILKAHALLHAADEIVRAAKGWDK